MSYQSQLAELKSIIEKIEYYKYTTNSLIYWDKITYMPKNAIGYRSKVMSFLAGEQYRLLSDSRFHKLAAYFKDNRKNDFLTDAMIKKLLVSAESVRAIPEATLRGIDRGFRAGLGGSEGKTGLAGLPAVSEANFRHLSRFHAVLGV